MDVLNRHYLNSLINLINVSIPFSNKDTEFTKLKYWVNSLSDKLNYTDVYNQLFDVCMTYYSDHIYLNQSYYLKYRSKCNIYHKRIIRNYDMLYPRPLSQYVFKNYNLTSKGKFHNLISGKGVPLPYNWWLKAKNTIYKTFKNREKLARILQESQAIDKDKEKFLLLNEEIMRVFFLKTETLNTYNLDLKKKIHMTLPILSEDYLDKDSIVESEDDDYIYADEKEWSKNDSHSNYSDVNSKCDEFNSNLSKETIQDKILKSSQNNGIQQISEKDGKYNTEKYDNGIEIIYKEIYESKNINKSERTSSFAYNLRNSYLNEENGVKNIKNDILNNSSKSNGLNNKILFKSDDTEKNYYLEKNQSYDKFKEYRDSDIRLIEDINLDVISDHHETDNMILAETQKSLENLKNKKHFKYGNLF